MANNVFLGGAQDVNQINTITVGGTNALGQVYTVTINLKEVAYTTDGTETNDEIATALYNLLAAATYGEFTDASWSVSTSVITAESNVGGTPFTQTSSATGTGTLVTATTQTASGHEHWDDADNWSLGHAPQAGEDVFIENTSVNIKWGLDQNSIVLGTLNISSTFTGDLGLPNTSDNNYAEYREKYLKIQFATLKLGYGTGSGSGRIKINSGSGTANTLNVYSTGSPAENGLGAVIWLGTNASNVLNVQQGKVSIAPEAGQAATLATVRIGSQSSQSTDVTLDFGPSVTLGTVNQSGGEVTSRSSLTALRQTAGTFTLKEAATLGTWTGDGGTLYYESSGKLTTGVARNDAKLDFSRDVRGRTVDNLTLNKGTSLLDPWKSVTWTNPMVVNCRLKELAEFDVGSNVSIQVT